MPTPRLVFASLAVATAAACSSSGSTSASSPGDGGMSPQDGPSVGLDASEGGPDGSGPTCSAIGAACAGNSMCCSLYCKAGTCACNSDGYACKTNVDCCASDCVQGTCGGKKDGGTTHPSGTPDTTYGSNGCTTVAYGNNDKNGSKPLAAALDSSGTLFLVGQTNTGGISGGSLSGWLSTLGPAGGIATNVALPTTFGPVYGLALSPAGATLFGDGKVERTDASGNVDPSFSWGLDAGVGAPSGEYQSTGALVILEGSNLVRLTASGAVDSTFGTGGSVAVTAMTPDSLVLDGSDRIYVAGSANGGSEWMLARYTPGGALDPTFGSQGLADAGPAPRDTLTGGRNYVRVSKSGNDAYVIGRDDDPNVIYTQLWIVHAGAAGVDGHAGLAAPTNVETTPDLVFSDAAVQDDGKLVVAGTDAMGLYWYLTRVSAPAAVDASYGNAGWVASRADTPSGGPGTTSYGPRFVALASNGGAIVVEERQYVENLYSEDNAIVCKFTP